MYLVDQITAAFVLYGVQPLDGCVLSLDLQDDLLCVALYRGPETGGILFYIRKLARATSAIHFDHGTTVQVDRVCPHYQREV